MRKLTIFMMVAILTMVSINVNASAKFDNTVITDDSSNNETNIEQIVGVLCIDGEMKYSDAIELQNVKNDEKR